MQSGKSTVAEYLVWKHDFVRVSFAGPIKRMARVFLEEFYKDEHHLNRMLGGDLKETSMQTAGLEASPRWIMQTLGTEWGRQLIDNEVWVKIAKKHIHEALSSGRSVVIDDMRFCNEYLLVKTAFRGQAWEVLRPNVVGSTHQSEGGLRNRLFDVTLQNSGTRDDLYRLTDSALGISTPLQHTPGSPSALPMSSPGPGPR